MSLIDSFGKTGVPVILVIGGLLATVFSKSAGAKYESLMSAAGFLAMGGGLALFVNTSAFSGANVTFPISTEVQTKMYANPVNNLSSIPKKNRFDLQTNYLIGNPNTNEEYMNNLILNEVKDMGISSVGHYPVKMNPWEIKTMIPTTQVEPSRDFNTVKMVMA